MVNAISSYGAFGISAMSAFSSVRQTQKIDPIITQDIKDASTVAKTATSLSDKVEAIRPNAKNDPTWAYVQSQNIGLPQAFDIEGMDVSENKIVIDLKGYNIPQFEEKPIQEVEFEEYKNAEEEVIADLAQEYSSRFQEVADDLISAVVADNRQEENSENHENFFANQYFGLSSYAQVSKAYENYASESTSFVA